MCETGVVDDNISVMGCWTNTAIHRFFQGADTMEEYWGTAKSSEQNGWREGWHLFLFPSLECEIAFSSAISSRPLILQLTPVTVQQLCSALAFGLGEEGRVAWGSRDEVTQPPASERLHGAIHRPCWYLGFGFDLRRGCISGKKLKRQEDGKAYL